MAEAAEQGHVLLAGDFNSRTAQLVDCTGPDELQQYLAVMPECQLPPLCTAPRTNSDHGDATSFGRQLIEMCQQRQLSILNGRTPGDMHGALTCFPSTGGSSTVDYYVASHQLLGYTSPTLQVLPRDPVSDHCALHLQLKTQPPSAAAYPQLAHQQPPCFKISPDRFEGYQSILKRPDIQQQLAAAAAPATPLQTSAEMLHGAMLQAAKLSFDMQGAAGLQCTSRFPSNPWYDEECKRLRRQLRDARNVDNNSAVSNQLAKEYDRVTRRKKRRFVRDQGASMVRLARQDSKLFWKKFRGRRADDSYVHDSASLSDHFEKLLNVQVSSSSSGPADNPFRRPAHDTSSLNSDFTLAEVTAGIRKMKRGKAADIMGIKADLLLSAVEPLAPTVTALFNKMFASQGDFPHCMTTGIIVSVYKSGDDQDPGNYRGITLGSVLGKLYAALIDKRLSSWTEANDLRARGQAGFRADHRTTDNVFILQTLIDQAKTHLNAKKRKLYTCFVDFSKAFDTIPRDLLWRRLQQLGVTGRILKAIQGMYSKVEVAIKTRHGILARRFDSTLGVKQGCPLSPTLFGLYIDELEPLLQQGSCDAPRLADIIAVMLLYADDIVLMSETAAGLQKQLIILGEFCHGKRLTVNLGKTQVLVFNARKPPRDQFLYQGQPLEKVMQYKYLGIEFHATKGCAAAGEKLAASAQRACFALHKRCGELHITSPQQKCDLLDALVMPVLTYCCEAWCVKFCCPKDTEQADRRNMWNNLERVHKEYLRRVLLVRKSTPREAILSEFGRFPLRVRWLEHALKYYNRLIALPDHRLVKRAFRASCNMAMTSHPSGWFYQLAMWIKGVLGQDYDLMADGGMGNGMPVEDIVHRAQQQYVSNWRLHAGSKLRVYGEMKVGYSMEAYLSHRLSASVRRSVSQLRTGSHHLAVETSRWSGQSNICQCCTLGEVEDAEHLLFDCPAYADIQLRYYDLFTVGASFDMPSLFTNNHMYVSSYIHECMRRRDSLLSLT